LCSNPGLLYMTLDLCVFEVLFYRLITELSTESVGNSISDYPN